MDAIKASWNGKERLWKVFWIYNWLFGTAINLVWESVRPAISTRASVIVMLVLLPYAVWSTVSLWRCAFNADWRGWGYVARGCVVLGILGLCIVLFAVFYGLTHG